MNNYGTVRRGMSKGKRLLAAVVIVAAVAAVAIWVFWPRSPARVPAGGGGAPDANEGAGRGVTSRTRKVPASGPTTGPAGWPGPGRPDTSITLAEAPAAYKRGIQLLEARKYIKARGELSKALRSGRLGREQQAETRKALELLADVTIFSPRVFKGDPLTFMHLFKPRQVLAGRRGLIRQMKLRVPHQVILKANRLRDARRIQAGRKYKLIRGPFHAVIYKSKRVMDVYLQDTFVKRYRVCVGAARTPTPEGYFRVAWSEVGGGKTMDTVYYPPAGSGVALEAARSIAPDEDGYPLDKRGHNIKLHGIAERGTDIEARDGYAVHGTNNPACIGKAVSLGCVRLSEKDIVEVYAMLYERWSTVTIRP